MKRCWAILLIVVLCLTPLASFAAAVKVEPAPLVADTAQRDGTIRVWLSTLSGSTYTVTIAGDYTINGDTSRQLKDGSKVTVSFSGGSVYLNSQSMGSGFTLTRHAGGSGYNAVKIAQSLVPGNYYPGDIQFVVSGGKGYVIAHLYIEDYIYGVLPYEMDNGWPLEALKAQAVAARTYAIRAKTSGGLYDVTDTTQHQVFRGVNYNKTNCIKAVDETWGVVMKYGDDYVSAYYSASNGGQTETNSNYWGGKQLPYLQVKDDPFDLANPNASVKSYMIYSSPSYGTSTSAYEMIAAAIAAKTGLSASQVTIKEINSVAFDTPKYADPSRLYTNMTVKATYNGSKSVTVSIPVFDTVKNALSLKLNNAQNEMFSVVKEQKGFRVYARRWGHGVGMSQRGAAQMANTGYNYAQILGFYYTGITRVRMEFVRSLAGSISGRPVEAVPTPAPVEDAQALATQVKATVTLSNSADKLNMRDKPSTSGKRILKIADGEEVEVLQSGDWAKIRYNGKEGYVKNDYLLYQEEEPQVEEVATEQAKVTLTSGTLNVRQQASARSERLGAVENGATVTVLATEGSWTKIYTENLTGYVLSRYLTKIEPAATAAPSAQPTAAPTAAPAAKSGEAAWVICDEDSNVNLRKRARTTATILKRLPYGTEVQVLEKSGKWCKVTCDGTTGYIAAEYLSSANPAAVTEKNLVANEDVIYGKTVWLVTDSGEPVNMRAGASSDAKTLSQIASGTEVTLINTINASWYKIIAKGLTGYVAAKFVKFDDPNGTAETETPAEDTAAYTKVLNTGKVDMNSKSATLHLRKTMDDLADITGTLKQGEAIEVLHYGEGGAWLYVRCGSLQGYMHAEFARLKYSVAQVSLEDADSQLILRQKASKSSDMVTKLKQGTGVTILSQSGDWSRVRLEDGTEGYVVTRYLKVLTVK